VITLTWPKPDKVAQRIANSVKLRFGTENRSLAGKSLPS
jgi:hypothetical protein